MMRPLGIVSPLCVGFGMTIGVAWWTAVSIDVYAEVMEGDDVNDQSSGQWYVGALNARGARITLLEYRGTYDPDGNTNQSATAKKILDRAHVTLGKLQSSWVVDDRGYPFLCMRCGYLPVYEGVVTQWNNAIPTKYSPWIDEYLRSEVPRLLPCRPISIGFVANWITYSLGAWALLHCVSMIRAAARLHRGHCSRCNYDLRGSTTPTCPECGLQR